MTTVGEALKLDRNDIKDWPRESIDMIMERQSQGWRASRSNNNHVMLLAPDGKTRLSVSRNSSSPKYLREDLKRYDAGQPTVRQMVEPKTKQTWPCPRPGCKDVFIEEEFLNVHIAVDHEGQLVCPECGELFKRANVLGNHRSRKHGYISPTYVQRQLAKERREGKIPAVPEKPAKKPTPPREKTVALAKETQERPTVVPVSEKIDIPVEHQYRDLELTDEVLSMDIRTLVAVLNAAGMKVRITVANRTTE